MKKLYIALDGGKKLSLGSPETYKTKRFRLRTVDKNQYQARINIGLTDGGENYVLRSVYLENLKSSESGYSFLQCQLEQEGSHLILTIKNDGRVICRERFLRTPKKIILRNFLLILCGILLLGGLTAFVLLTDFSWLTAKGSGDRTVMEETSTLLRDKAEEKSEIPPAGEVVVREDIPEKATEAVEVESEVDSFITEEDRASDGVEEEPVINTVEIRIEKPDFTIVDENDLILHFTPNSSALSGESVRSLENVLAFLLENPSVHVKITGHCAIAGTEAGRKEISVQRALNVEAWLMSRGWQPENPPLVKGEAGSFPLTMDPDNQEINRRVELDLSEE